MNASPRIIPGQMFNGIFTPTVKVRAAKAVIAITMFPRDPATASWLRLGSGPVDRDSITSRARSKAIPFAISERVMCGGNGAPGVARNIRPVTSARSVDVQCFRVIKAKMVNKVAIRKKVSVVLVTARARLET